MKREETKKYIWIVVLIVILILIDQGIKLLAEKNFMGQDITLINRSIKIHSYNK